MPKLTAITKHSADFKALQKLRRTFDTARERNRLQKHGELKARTDAFTALQSEVIASDTQIRKDRAAAKLLSKATLPAGFVPFDPKGSGFLDDLRNQISDDLRTIFGSDPNDKVDGTGATLDYHSPSFDAAFDDKVSQIRADTNAGKSGIPTYVFIGAGVLVLVLLIRR